ncbi:ComEA family DNA-binding protein [Trujillonella endophytica]|uniref:Competence protein ComEA n=1 Tax=Trujillonella endophytica TaxID=673521 RepID=A0A1H8QYR2_9ACTN|nr:ComEA family DNA-binding protein [Trujillella endophytica]SEO58994.1 competence protein ComEA [Trujillella endophytica]
MRLSSRRVDDADLIRARLRVLLDEGRRTGGWLPDELPGVDDCALPATRPPPAAAGRPEARVDEEPVDEESAREALPAGLGRHRAPGPAVRIAPGRRSVRGLLLAALLGAVLLVAWTWLDRPRAEPVGDRFGAAATAEPAAAPAAAAPSVGTAAETAPTVTVAVVGQVVRPGLVELPQGSRVADAVAAAGGLLPGADPAVVNLAAVLADGQQIAVGVPGAAAAPGAAPPAAAGRVPLNSATAAQLDALPGIGPVLAQRIVDHRDEHGPFTAVEQLEDVPGIGPATFDDLAGLVAV